MYEVNIFLACAVIAMLHDYRKSPTEKLRSKFHGRNRSSSRKCIRTATNPVKSVNPTKQVKGMYCVSRSRHHYRRSILERFLLSCRPRNHKYKARSSRRINGKFQYKYW